MVTSILGQEFKTEDKILWYISQPKYRGGKGFNVGEIKILQGFICLSENGEEKMFTKYEIEKILGVQIS